MVKTTQFHNFAKVLLANENTFENKNRFLVVAEISVKKTGQQIPKNIAYRQRYQITPNIFTKRQ